MEVEGVARDAGARPLMKRVGVFVYPAVIAVAALGVAAVVLGWFSGGPRVSARHALGSSKTVGSVSSAKGGASSLFSFGPWSGYVWQGRVRSVQASWSVPRVLSGSPAGFAATWIGVQAPPVQSRSIAAAELPRSRWTAAMWRSALLQVPFLQVGTNEERGVSRNGNAYNVYYAFWTDTAHRFSPIPLFAVRPGDDVSARLRFVNDRWAISIADSTSGSLAVRYTRDETGPVFNLADWLQEHPSFRTVDAAGQDAYPTLSTVRIHGLAVNGRAPRFADVLSTWMSENGGYLAPGALNKDSFVFRPATLSPTAKRYLAIATQQNVAVQRLSALERQWTAATANAQTAWRRQLAAAFLAFNAALSNSHWPHRVEGLVKRLITENRALLAASGSFSKRSTASTSRWLKATLAASTTAHAIRRTLDIPQMSALQ